MWFARLRPGKLLAGSLSTLSLWLIASVLLVSMPWASAADPLGASPHNDGTTTFRVWAPFVDAVAVKINGGTPVPPVHVGRLDEARPIVARLRTITPLVVPTALPWRNPGRRGSNRRPSRQSRQPQPAHTALRWLCLRFVDDSPLEESGFEPSVPATWSTRSRLSLSPGSHSHS